MNIIVQHDRANGLWFACVRYQGITKHRCLDTRADAWAWARATSAYLAQLGSRFWVAETPEDVERILNGDAGDPTPWYPGRDVN